MKISNFTEIHFLFAIRKYKPLINDRIRKANEDEKKLPPQEREKRRKEREDQAKQILQEEQLRREREQKILEEKEREKALKEDSTLEDLLGEIGAELEGKVVVPPSNNNTTESKDTPLEDFEQTMAELENFINGEMFSSLHDQTQVEKGIDLLTQEETNQEISQDKTPPFNVYLNYNSFKLQDFAVNHFNQPTSSKMTLRFGKKKKDHWIEMLSHTKVSIGIKIKQI